MASERTSLPAADNSPSEDDLQIVSERIVRRPRPSDEVVLVSHTRKRARVVSAPVMATAVSAADDDDEDSPDEDYEAPLSDTDIDIDGVTNATSLTNTNTSSGPNRLPSAPFTCGVCMARKEACDGVALGASTSTSAAVCACVVCRECSTRSLRGHVARNTWPITCPNPGCGGEREGWECVKDLQWQDAAAGDALSKLILLNNNINNNNKIKYCANNQCSTPFEFDPALDDGSQNSARVQCPLCKSATCVRCDRAWHHGKCTKV